MVSRRSVYAILGYCAVFTLLPAVALAFFTVTLNPGDTHPEVLLLQQYLNTHGYQIAETGDGSPGSETTYMGPATVAALKRFQSANNLLPSGVAGPFTREVLNVKSSVTTRGAFSTNLGAGLDHPEVLLLQQYLNTHGYQIAETGDGSPGSETTYMGPATVAALKRFQSAKGLDVTGVVGPATREVLNENTVSSPVVQTLTPPPVVPPVANESTALFAEIERLLIILRSLQAQLAAISGGVSISSAQTFTTTLNPGDTHPEVLLLQQYLNTHGYQVAEEGPGAPGFETSYFGSLTVSALSKFQSDKNIPVTGRLDEASRNILNTTSQVDLPAGISSSTEITVNATATPNKVKYKGSSEIVWSSTGATSCQTPWGMNTTYGSYTLTSLRETTSYTITCSSGTASALATVAVTVSSSGGGGGGGGSGGGGGGGTPEPEPEPEVYATSIVLTGPTSGIEDVASSVFIVSADATLTDSITVTPSAIGGGSFSPTSVQISPASPTATFVYTPTSIGTKSISVTNNGGLTNPSAASYVVTGAGSFITTFTLTAASTSPATPFTIGHAFRAGDVPSGYGVVVSGADAQVVPRNYWPDGSLRLATISGTLGLTANEVKTLTLTVGTPSSGTVLTTTDLKDTDITASVDAGAFGLVSWSDTDWDTPFMSWVSGHRMSSWIYRKSIGADPHLVAWLEVRLYANGQVEVLPWIENGYLMVAGPTNKSTTYTFTLGGVEKFSSLLDVANHTRTPLISGTSTSYWLDDDLSVIPRHNVAYLQSTKLVPSYYGSVSNSSSLVTNLPDSYTPFQQGGYSGSMGTAGYHPSIGLLPQWDVLYLTSSAPSVWSAVERNAYSAGRYGIYYRDETTNLPIKFSDHPTLGVGGGSGISSGGASAISTPTASGTTPPVYASSHAPAMGYMAGLLTGRYYHTETTQFQATLNYLKNSNSNRQNEKGIFMTDVGANTTRGAAWAIRTLAQAIVLTGTSSPLYDELTDSLEANIDYFYDIYVGQSNNPYGFLAPYSDYTGVGDGVYYNATWMEDFFTAAIGMTKSFDLSLSAPFSTELDQFFDWKAESVIGRLGTAAAADFLYRDATPYTIAVAPSDTPDFIGGAGPWHANWGAIWDDTITGVTKTLDDGTLRGGNFPDATSYWGNMQPAIAYAVEHGVSGAEDAYLRMTDASNWPTLSSNFDDVPEWGVRPPVIPTGEAAWVDALPLWEWYEIPDTALSSIAPSPTPLGSTGPSSKISTWNGAGLKTEGSVYMLGAAGGHADYAGNEVNAITLNSADPQWVELSPPTANADIVNQAQFYLDNKPAATHTYYATQFINSLNRMIVFASAGLLGPFPAPPDGYPYASGGGAPRSFVFNLDTNQWELPDYLALYEGGGDSIAALTVKHPVTEDVYYSRSYNSPGSGWWRWNSASNTWTNLGGSSRDPWYAGSAIDPTRDRMLVVGGFSTTTPSIFNLLGQSQSVTFTGLGAAPITFNGGYPGVVYDEVLDAYLVVHNTGSGIKIVRVDAGTLEVSEPSVTGVIPNDRPNGIHNSIQYVPELKGIVIANDYYGNVKFMRTAP